jgi:hypothetical protein
VHLCIHGCHVGMSGCECEGMLATLFFNKDITPLTEDLAMRTGETAYEGKGTFYDALPVAIVEHKKTVCITADRDTIQETSTKKLSHRTSVRTAGWDPSPNLPVNIFENYRL